MKYVPEENEIVWNMKSFPVSGGYIFSFLLFDISCVYKDSDKSRVQLYSARGTFIVCFTYRGKSGHLRVTFMPNGKSEIVPRDQFSSYSNYCLPFITSTRK